MGRLARVIAVGVAHHVTQRGNGRRFLLESDTDRRVYLDLLRENLALHEGIRPCNSILSQERLRMLKCGYE